MKSKCILTYILSLTLFTLTNLYGQCNHQVTHAEGTTIINGIEVTATPLGYADILNTCEYSEPYIIGWNFDPLPHEDGGYTFQFSPPIDSLNLIFSYINATNGTEEIVRLYKNGEHYIITEVRDSMSCSDSLAIITEEGDLAGRSPEYHYGGNVVVNGPIHELTLIDSFLVGQPLGVSFSLFICSEFTTSIIEDELSSIKIFPIPSKNSVTVEGISTSETKFELFDLSGKPIYIDPIKQVGRAIFDVDHLPNGIYYLSISVDEHLTTRKIIVSRD